MSDLEGLGFLSITEMSHDEQLELIRQIRLGRRIPVKQTKTTTVRKKLQVSTSALTADQAAALLKIIGENK